MTSKLSERLNRILPHVTEKSFLSSEGIGNEIACYIFDYPAEEELQVRAHMAWMMERVRSHHKHLRFLHLDLLDVVVAYLEKRGLLEKALAMQQARGDAAVFKALRGPLTAEKLRDEIAAEYGRGGVLAALDAAAAPMSAAARPLPVIRATSAS